MAKHGYRIFDSDTHVGPYMEVLDKYLSADDRSRLAGWEQYKTLNKRGQDDLHKRPAPLPTPTWRRQGG